VPQACSGSASADKSPKESGRSESRKKKPAVNIKRPGINPLYITGAYAGLFLLTNFGVEIYRTMPGIPYEADRYTGMSSACSTEC